MHRCIALLMLLSLRRPRCSPLRPLRWLLRRFAARRADVRACVPVSAQSAMERVLQSTLTVSPRVQRLRARVRACCACVLCLPACVSAVCGGVPLAL